VYLPHCPRYRYNDPWPNDPTPLELRIAARLWQKRADVTLAGHQPTTLYVCEYHRYRMEQWLTHYQVIDSRAEARLVRKYYREHTKG
jgi:hypothetical protein